MNYTCEICGETFEPYLKHMSYGFADIPYPNRVRVEIVYSDSLAIHSFKTCQRCAGEVMAYIYHKKRENDERRKLEGAK